MLQKTDYLIIKNQSKITHSESPKHLYSDYCVLSSRLQCARCTCNQCTVLHKDMNQSSLKISRTGVLPNYTPLTSLEVCWASLPKLFLCQPNHGPPHATPRHATPHHATPHHTTLHHIPL